MKGFLILSLVSIVSVFFTPIVIAQDFDIGGGVVDIEPIQIPLFGTTYMGFLSNASIISWLSFVGTLLTGIISVFWVFRILVAGVNALRSEGDQTKLQESYSQLRSSFIGIFITFLIPVILSIIGVIFGIGSILQWPESFQLCQEGSDYQFYFEALLKEGDKSSAESSCGI
jgi:hypothetical protein